MARSGSSLRLSKILTYLFVLIGLGIGLIAILQGVKENTDLRSKAATSIKGPFQEKDGKLVMEAENYDSAVGRSPHSWKTLKDKTGYSGTGGFIYADPNTGVSITSDIVNKSPETTYQVAFSTSGTYYLWVRTWAANGGDDSLHMGINKQVKSSSDNIDVAQNSTWSWGNRDTGGSRLSLYVPAKGLYTINVWMREDGVRLDKIFLTKNSSTSLTTLGLTGIGPAESPRSTSLSTVTTSGNCSSGLTSCLEGYWPMDELYAAAPINRKNVHNKTPKVSDFEDGRSDGGDVESSSVYAKIQNSAFFKYDQANFRYKSPFLVIPSTKTQPMRDGVNGSFTIAGWVYFVASVEIPHYDYIFWKQLSNNGVGEFLLKGSKETYAFGFDRFISFTVGNATLKTDPATVPVNNGWNFVVARFDGSTNKIKLRVNTKNAAEISGGGSPFNLSDQRTVIGGKQCTAICSGEISSGFGGFLDEVGFWSKSLTDAEVTALYNGGAGLAYPLDGTTLPTPTPVPPTPTPTQACTFNLIGRGSLFVDPLAVGAQKALELAILVGGSPVQATNVSTTSLNTSVLSATQPTASSLCFSSSPCYTSLIKGIGYGTTAVRLNATVPGGSCATTSPNVNVSGNLLPTATPPYNAFTVSLTCQKNSQGTNFTQATLTGGPSYNGKTVYLYIANDSGSMDPYMWTPDWNGSMSNTTQFDGLRHEGGSYQAMVRVFAEDSANSKVYEQTQTIVCQ